jgi:HPt (histidine-containing phosphotransfer) domain-containing protein
MPFDKFVDIEALQEVRRKHIRESLRSISIEELRKLAKEHEDEFVNDPWRDKLLRLIEERPQASFYHAAPQENVVVIYCRDEDFGLWILPGSGMGPLPEDGKRHVKEALGQPVSSEKEIPQPGQFFRDTQNPKSTKN